MVKTVACGITLYNPDKKSLHHLYDYLKLFDNVYIFDNTESYSDENVISTLEDIKKYNNLIYISYNKNLGLPKAFNEIIRLCKDDFLCTLDQDSLFERNQIIRIIDILDSLDSNIAIIAPKIIYNGIKVDYKDNTILDKRYLITSGSFLNLHILKNEKIQYDEKYFIDKFEIDLCETLKRRGYRIVQYQGAILYQKLGDDRRFGHSTHNIIRHYYLFRNRFYFNKKFYPIPKRYILNFLQTFHHFIVILLYENDKIEKLKIFCKAISDYKNNIFYEYKSKT